MKTKKNFLGALIMLMSVLFLANSTFYTTVKAEEQGEINPDEYQDVTVLGFSADGKTTTKVLTILLENDLSGLEGSKALSLTNPDVATIESISKTANSGSHSYDLRITVKKDGEIGIIPFFELNGTKYKLVENSNKIYGKTVSVFLKRDQINVLEVHADGLSNTSKITLQLEKKLPFNELKLGVANLLKLDSQIVETKNLKEIGEGIYQIVIVPKKTGFLTFADFIGNQGEEGEVVRLIFPDDESKRIRIRKDTDGNGQTRVNTTLETDGEATTKKLILTLSHEISDLEKKHFNFKNNGVMEVESVNKIEPQSGSEYKYEIGVRALKEGTVILDEILNERSDYVFAFNDGLEKLSVVIMKEKKMITVTKFEAEQGENTRNILLNFDQDVENLEISDLQITNNNGNNVVIGALTKVSAREYKIGIEVKTYTSYEVLLTGVKEKSDVKFKLQNNTPMSATVKKDKKVVTVTELKAKSNTELLLKFDQAVEGLQKENIGITPNDAFEIVEMNPVDDTKCVYLIKIRVKKVGKVRLSGIENVEGHEFYGFAEGQLEVNITISVPVYDYYPELLEKQKAEKKVKEAKKDKEIEKEVEKNTKESANSHEHKKEKDVEKRKVVSVKKGKNIDFTLRKRFVKEAIEKGTPLIVNNKKEMVEISADTVKKLAGKKNILKLTLKLNKKAGKKIHGVKKQMTYIFKVNESYATVKSPVKLTLMYKGGKLPKVFTLGKKGELLEIKKVNFNKKEKTLTFMTRKIRNFVIAY